MNFGKFARLGLSIYVTAKIQPKRFRPEELEIRVNTINLLSEMKDKLVSKITLQLPITELDDTMVSELSALMKNNSGNSLLYFHIIGEEENLNLQLFSRPSKIQVNKHLIDSLKNNLQIEFKIN